MTPVPQKQLVGQHTDPEEGEPASVKEVRTGKVFNGVIIKKGKWMWSFIMIMGPIQLVIVSLIYMYIYITCIYIVVNFCCFHNFSLLN